MKKWQNLRIGAKLAIGFGCMVLLITLSGLVGYAGLRTMGRSLTILGDEEAPVVDAAMEMKIALMEAMTAMDEYMAATAVIATDDADSLADIETSYQKALDEFDQLASAILNGGRLADGTEIIPTDNQELARLVKQANELHDQKYQVAAKTLMDKGRNLLTQKTTSDSAMSDLEKVFDEVFEDSINLEKLVASGIRQEAERANIGQAAREILDRQVPLADMAMEIKFSMAMTRILMEEFVQTRDQVDLVVIKAEFERWVKTFDELAGAMLQGGEIDGERIHPAEDPQIRAAVEEMDRNHGEFQAKAAAMMSAHESIVRLAAETQAAMAQADLAGDEAIAALGRVEELSAAEMDRAKTEGYSSGRSAKFWLVVVVGASILLGTFLGIIITRGLSRPITRGVKLAEEIARGDFRQRLNLQRGDEIGLLAGALDRMAENLQANADLAEKIAEGDLDVEVKLASEKDQLGLALQTMVNNLQDLLGQIQVSGEQIAAGSSQVSDASQTLSQGATEQASSLEEISASMHEMTAQIKTNADNATQANTLSGEARKAAENGSRRMSEMVAAMDKIAAAGENISRIIKVIDEIAFQTNLLALNAAVEAARAGQHGKGFAVVAEEVRNLAARSAEAARETAELIEGTVALTSTGGETAGQTEAALAEILRGITQVNDLVAEIAAASTEQSQGLGQISEGLGQIDQVTQQNTASAEESAAAAEELAAQAGQMQSMLRRFKLRGAQQRLQLPAPSSQARAVGQWPETASGMTQLAPSRASTVIALDDNEFGKY